MKQEDKLYSPRSSRLCSPRRFQRARGEKEGKILEGLRDDLGLKLGKKKEDLKELKLERQTGRQGLETEVFSPPLSRQVSFIDSKINFVLQDKPNLYTCQAGRCKEGRDWCLPGQTGSCGTKQPIGVPGTTQGMPGTRLGQHGGTGAAEAVGDHLAINHPCDQGKNHFFV